MIPENNNTITDLKGKKLYTEYDRTYENRPTIVYLHDSLGCVQLWRDFPHKLAAATRCNVLLYDRLGYGRSAPMPSFVRPTHYMELEADTLNELLLEFGIDQAILFGHSDGGTIALLTAGKHPERVKAIIVEAAHIFVEEITLQGISEAIESYQNTNLPERLAKYHGSKVEAIFKAWTETWTRNDYRDWNIEHLLPGITCPLLFIQGEADEYGTLKQVEKTIRQVRGTAERYIIPNIGHTPHKEAPQAVLDRTVDYIRKLTGE